MLRFIGLALGLALASAGPAGAADWGIDPFFGSFGSSFGRTDKDPFGSFGQPVGRSEMESSRVSTPITPPPAVTGGSSGGDVTVGSGVGQGNNTDQSGSNVGNITVGADGSKISGTIHQSHVTGNNGLVMLMQNTGDLVNMNNATSINVYLK